MHKRLEAECGLKSELESRCRLGLSRQSRIYNLTEKLAPKHPLISRGTRGNCLAQWNEINPVSFFFPLVLVHSFASLVSG